MSNQLKILIPAESIETSQGIIILKPFALKDWNRAIAILSRWLTFMAAKSPDAFIANALAMFGPGGDSPDGEFWKTLESSLTQAGTILMEDGIELLSLASEAEKFQFQELTYDEFFGLLTKLIEQNKSFFARLGKSLNESIPPESA